MAIDFSGKKLPTYQINITSNNQSGGITAHTVNIQKPAQRSISTVPGLEAEILTKTPRDRKIRVVGVMGDGECHRFALEIHGFLSRNGFDMVENGISQAIFGSVPPPLSGRPAENGEFEIVVGHAS